MTHWNRRQFLGRSAAATVALSVIHRVAVADETTIDALLKASDPALLIRTPSVPEGDNALPLLVQAAERMTPEPFADWEVEADLDERRETPRVREFKREYSAWVEKNQPSLELMRQAALRDRLSFGDEPWTDKRFDLIQGYRSLSRLAVSQADRFAEGHRLPEAIQLGLSLEKVFRLLRDGGGMVVEYLVACASHSDALGLARRLAYSRGGSPEAIAKLLSGLPQVDRPIDGLKQSMRVE